MGILTEQTRQNVEEAIRTKSPVVWLDKKGEFAPLVGRWKDGSVPFPFPVYSFEGSYLELMLASREILAGKHPSPCLFYLRNFGEDEIRHTPLYETCRAGQTWKTDLSKILREAGQGLLSSEQIEHILGRDNLDIASAEILTDGMAGRAPELDREIARLGEDGLIVAFLEEAGKTDIGVQVMADHLNRVFGLDAVWLAVWDEDAPDPLTAMDLCEGLASYLLCMEYACDLSCEPPTERLAGLKGRADEYRSRVRRFLKEMRKNNGPLYAKWAERIENSLWDEEKDLSADQLGMLDTFRFEADISLEAAFDALKRNDWSAAATFAEPRLADETDGANGRTFWVKNEISRERVWKWIDSAARLGREILQSGENNLKAETTVAALGSYTAFGWKTDSLHRHYRLLTAGLNTASFPDRYDDFVSIRTGVNRMYRTWADNQARRWNALCARDGFAGTRETGQRYFFERTLEPLLRAGTKTALVLVDAFRYELGEELLLLLGDYTNGTKPLSAMLAELPTVTAVGMNALMPVARDGRVDPLFDKSGKKILGFRSGERQVTTPDSRQRVLAEYAGGRCEWTELATFLDSGGKDLARLVSGKLLVVTTPDIDTLGESGTETFGIDYFQPVLARLKQAVEKLREAGFERILITADHGFLLGDETVANGHASQLDKAERRHAFDIERNGDNLVSVPLVSLGWLTDDGLKALVMDRSTHLLTTARAATFYHGGNSLEERVIPLITLSGGAPVQMSAGRYRIAAASLPPVFGTNRLKLSVLSEGDGELFGPETVEVRLSPETGIHVHIGDAGSMRFTGDTIEVPVDGEIVVSFRLESVAGGKSRLEISQVSQTLKLCALTTADYFDVARIAGEAAPVAAVAAAAAASTHWAIPGEFIPGEYHAALQHLYKHSVLSEAFLRNTLGDSPEASRKARRFASKIGEWVQYLPFSITVQVTADGTEYRKE